MWRQVSAWLEPLLDLLFPPADDRCAVCGAEAPAPQPLCRPCRAALAAPVDRPVCPCCCRPLRGRGPAVACRSCAEGDHPYRRVVAAGLYHGPLRQALVALKFYGRADLAPLLGDLVAAAAAAPISADVVVAVPEHRSRRSQRDYNPAALLAAHVARSLGLPLCDGALVRTRAGRQRSRLSRRQRQRSAAKVFAASAAWQGQNLRVLLVDDVLTTGWTAGACARALLAAGAATVDVAVLAVSDYPVDRGF